MEGKNTIFQDFCLLDVDQTEKRETCHRCLRPVVVCWCAFLPREPVEIRTTVIILQHGYEEKRALKTAPMLENSLAKGKCTILRGTRFPLHKYDILREAAQDPSTVLLYPSPDAHDIGDGSALPVCETRTLILLDGTWRQANGIYNKNEWLQKLRQVKLTHYQTSEYIIRTQPTETSLCTLESAALALSILEQRPQLLEILLAPLRGMCSYQLNYGAVTHQSKQFLIENGLYKKQELKPTDKVGRSRPRNRPKNLKDETIATRNDESFSGDSLPGFEKHLDF